MTGESSLCPVRCARLRHTQLGPWSAIRRTNLGVAHRNAKASGQELEQDMRRPSLPSGPPALSCSSGLGRAGRLQESTAPRSIFGCAHLRLLACRDAGASRWARKRAPGGVGAPDPEDGAMRIGWCSRTHALGQARRVPAWSPSDVRWCDWWVEHCRPCRVLSLVPPTTWRAMPTSTARAPDSGPDVLGQSLLLARCRPLLGLSARAPSPVQSVRRDRGNVRLRLRLRCCACTLEGRDVHARFV